MTEKDIAMHQMWAFAFAQAFPPSLVDYYFRGQTTSLPGHEKLTRAMPAVVAEYLERAEEDAEAETYADSVNGSLKPVGRSVTQPDTRWHNPLFERSRHVA